MKRLFASTSPRAVASRGLTLCLGFCWALSGPALAEKADRGKPMVIEADKPGTVDLQRRTVTFNGNVAIVQGTLSLRAERIEVRESPTGDRSAVLVGQADKPAAYRQRREVANEWIEGRAERIEFDTRTDTLKFNGGSQLRFLRGAEVTDEVLGETITWNNSSGQLNVVGGAPSVSNPSGRIRAVLSPRPESAASAPSGAAAPEGLTLKPSTRLGGDSQ